MNAPCVSAPGGALAVSDHRAHPPQEQGRAPRVLHCIASLKVGGAGTLLLENLRQFARMPSEHHVCYFLGTHDRIEEFRAIGIEPVYLAHRGPHTTLRTLWRLYRLVRRLKIEVVHTHLFIDTVLGRAAALMAGVPVVTTLHCSADAERAKSGARRSRRWWGNMVEDHTARLGTDVFVAVSQAACDNYVQYRRVPAARVTVLRSGLDIERLSRPGSSDNMGLDTPVLLSVGRLQPIKGHALLIPMMKLVLAQEPRARLLIAGEGGERSRIERLIRDAGLEESVLLLGQRSDIPALLESSTLFVLPSLSEALPLAVLEAMAAGCPVVATRVGGVPELVVHGETGLLVEPGDCGALAAAVLELIGDRERARRLSANARRCAREQFDANKAAKRLLGIYKDLSTRRFRDPRCDANPQAVAQTAMHRQCAPAQLRQSSRA
jgi:glycosyltransferase involved in cell wall biosynthesis